MRRSPMKPGKPMKRGGPLLRTAMKRKQRRVTAAERTVYVQATENARNADGVLICASCSKPIAEGTEQRDHLKSRGAGGKTAVDNIRIRHSWCHEAKHGATVVLADGTRIEPERFEVDRSTRSGSAAGGGHAMSCSSAAPATPETVFTCQVEEMPNG